LLILTRKIGEGIILGDDIRIAVLEIRGKQIRIGIEAPNRVSILRMEVFEKIQNENIESASQGIDDITNAVELIKNKFPKEESD